jgi:hypothetical protein
MKKSFISLLLVILIVFSIQCLPVCAADDVVKVKVLNQFCNQVTFGVYYYSGSKHQCKLDFGDGSSTNLTECGQGLIRHDFQPGLVADYKVTISTYDAKKQYSRAETIASIPELAALNLIYPVEVKDKTVTIKTDCFTGISTLNWGDGTNTTIYLDADTEDFTKTLSHTYQIPSSAKSKTYKITLEAVLDPDNADNTRHTCSAVFNYLGSSKKPTLEVITTYVKSWDPPAEITGIYTF